jgi:hypothetical protein
MADEGARQALTIIRVVEVLTLIPAWSLTAAIIAWYNSHGANPPGGVLCLFIVTLLSSVWAFCILIAVARARNTALWIAFWDLVAVGILIAGVATTSNIANIECNAFSQNTIFVTSDGQQLTAENTGNGKNLWDNPNNCNLIRAAWGLTIANIILFFLSAILAVVIYRQNLEGFRERVVVGKRPRAVEEVYVERPRRARTRSSSHRSSRNGRTRRQSRSHSYGGSV